MDRWLGKVAVVTGASSGIGAAIAVDLVKAGVNVVGLARHSERIEALRDTIEKPIGKLYAIKCDVTKEEDIKKAFAWTEENLGGVDILVNNAGIIRSTFIVEKDNTKLLKEILDTNILGVALCTREAFQSMKRRNVDGHIVMINSTAGHIVEYVVGTFPSYNMYPPSKFAITGMTEVLRQEFQALDTRVKVTSISPGVVRTDLYLPEHQEEIKKLPYLDAEDVSQAVLYVLGTPPHVQVHELIIKPIGEPF